MLSTSRDPVMPVRGGCNGLAGITKSIRNFFKSNIVLIHSSPLPKVVKIHVHRLSSVHHLHFGLEQTVTSCDCATKKG